uniref:Uncharacterized protein n=1 Tax=viral metagenome TaxID=1070528 RepID=A0A6C0KD10_9ZZZZ
MSKLKNAIKRSELLFDVIQKYYEEYIVLCQSYHSKDEIESFLLRRNNAIAAFL